MVGAIFFEAARVPRVAGADALVAVLAVGLTRFFGTLSSSFSLSPSSDGRFLPLMVGFGAGFGAAFAGGALVLRAAGWVAARTGTGAGAFSFLAGEGLATLTGAFADGSSSSTRLMLRLLLGMRFTRLSRRDRRLATCASHIATSFSPRAFSSSSKLALMAALASEVMCDMFVDVCLLL